MLRMHLNPFPEPHQPVHRCTKNLKNSQSHHDGPYSNSTTSSALYTKFLLSIWIASIILATLIPGTHAQLNPSNGICTSKYIRNRVSDLERLSGCRVIEGDLQLTLMYGKNSSEFDGYSFPELREITGCFLLSVVDGLQSLRNLFPNLAVIRGQTLIHNYAFLIYKMDDLHEVGLPSLTNVLNRGVYISSNPNLCYVDTVDWARITNDSKVNFFKENSDRCPKLCPLNCPKAESDNRDLCWNNKNCQIVHQSNPKCSCGGQPCDSNGECCDEHCIGGCTGRGPSKCHVCKTLEISNESSPDPKGFLCVSKCPMKTYEYMNRRCVTEDECHNITSYDVKKKEHIHGIRLDDYNGRDVCVFECPNGYTLVDSENGLKNCTPCQGPCKKECPGTYVDSVGASVKLKGCTTIKGTLKIQIRGYVKNLAKALEDNMNMIEDIHGSLVVSNSLSISSLSFLKSLKWIRGKPLEEQTYAVVVKSNDNLQELWDFDDNHHVEVTLPTARVLFHMNPKLCPQTIRDFVKHSRITLTKDDIDIGITNGDKVPCNKKKLNLRIVSRVNNSVTLKWENFRRTMTDVRLLLNYEIYYRISATQNASIYEDRDPCGGEGDDWKILDVPKLVFHGQQQDEPLEQESIITELKYYTQYAVYVKTVVLPDKDSANNNTAAVSDVVYFTTLPGVPSKPQDFTAVSNSSRGVIISWLPPEEPNGLITKYIISLKKEVINTKFEQTRDYCLEGRPPSDTKLGEIGTKESSATSSFVQQILEERTADGKECCSCSAATPSSKPKKDTSKESEVIIDTLVQDAIANAMYFENPNYKEPLLNETGVAQIENEIRRRRRRQIENDTSFSDDSKESDPVIMFPENVYPGEHVLPNPAGMQVYEEISENETIIISGRKIHFLPNLTHFTKYQIGIRVCRNISVDIVNDSRTCSELVEKSVTTLYSETADMVDAESIHINVTGNNVYARWDEPLNPNGIVMSYNVNITRLDMTKTGTEPAHIICITRQAFNESGRNFKFVKSLHPGNYSFRIQVVSLAPFDANYTIPKYFVILAVDGGMTPGNILAIILPIIILLLMTAAFFAYCIRTRRLVDKITSANPEYLANIDIPEEWELLRDKIDIGEQIGTGSFGVVYTGEIRDYRGKKKTKCAIKEVAKSAPSEDRFRFLQEALIMTQLDCHHVIKLLGVVSLSQPTLVIMELMVTDLKKYLRQRRPNEPESINEPPPTLRQILRMAAGIADGMAYLDSKGFVHRDLAARNCMVAEDMTVKVGDFGMTKDTDYYRKSTRGLLPVRWMAPESIKDGIFTIQSDLWSFGVVLWEMATLAAQPYQGLTNDQVIRYVRDCGIMERPENCPDILYNIMMRCWTYRPNERPTFSQILDWLDSDLDASFRQVSFYHSTAGADYRANLKARPETRIITSRTPLRATFDEDLNSENEEDDLIGSVSDEDHRHDTEDHAMLGKSPRYKPSIGAGTGTPYSMSDFPSAFTLPQSQTNTPPQSSTSCSPPLNPTSLTNNNVTLSGFITLDLNHASPQNSLELKKRSGSNDSQPNCTVPGVVNQYNVHTNGPSLPKSSPDSSDGISMNYSSADTGSVQLCNGIDTPIKHLPGMPTNCGYRTTPSTGGNGLRFDPSSTNLYLKKTNSTTQF